MWAGESATEINNWLQPELANDSGIDSKDRFPHRCQKCEISAKWKLKWFVFFFQFLLHINTDTDFTILLSYFLRHWHHIRSKWILHETKRLISWFDLLISVSIFFSNAYLHYIYAFSGCWKYKWSMQRSQCKGERSSGRVTNYFFRLTHLNSLRLKFFCVRRHYEFWFIKISTPCMMNHCLHEQSIDPQMADWQSGANNLRRQGSQ